MVNSSSYGDVRERSRATRRLENSDTFFLPDALDVDLSDSPLVAVIDDSMAVRRVVEISFQRVGISAIGYADGLLAMSSWERCEVAPPRVLLLDIGLPRVSGYEVAKHIRRNPAFAETRIIMLSGHDGPVDRTLSRFYGATGFISKPFKPSEMIRRVSHVLGIIDPGSDWPE